jgi:hypothetical protein
MAITTFTVTKSAGWARTDVILQLEEAFTWLELHGDAISGLVTSISAYSGGGQVGSSFDQYYDVFAASSSGIGTGASFEIYRSSGVVNTIYVNRPGVGYTNGEVVQISAEDIGGSVNGAVGIAITVRVAGGGSPVGYGSTNQFFDKNFVPSSDTTRPWGVLKQDFDTNKTFGVTYRGFKVQSDSAMSIHAGSSFFPFDIDNTSNLGGYYSNSFRGTQHLDIPANVSNTTNSLEFSSSNFQVSSDAFRYASDNSPTTHDLKLNIYRSSLDPSFAVLSFNQPSISGYLNQSTFSTFIIHNFNSNLWDLDEVFSAGITLVEKMSSITQNGGGSSQIGFKTYLVGNTLNNSNISFRSAESGWAVVQGSSRSGRVATSYHIASSQTNFTSATSGAFSYENLTGSNVNATIYSRPGGLKDTGAVGILNGVATDGNGFPITIYRSVIKGIPINGSLIPCPYFMPDDFAIIDFKLTESGQNIKQGDTITVSGSEVYTVITGSYNNFGETAGILFCARTV